MLHAGSGADSLRFTYGADGQRVSKTVGDPFAGGSRTYYIRDAQGNIMASYLYKSASGTGATMLLRERPIYGSKRIGSYAEEEEMVGAGLLPANYTHPMQTQRERYELTDHLGNVAAVVTGRLLNGANSGAPKQAELISAQGYEAFGSLLPGRNYSSDSYRFGFNGQMKDDEVYGSTGTSYTAEFWQYDARVGRRWNLDPVDKPWQSRYHAFSNNPISKIDPNGANDDWVQGADGAIKWDKDANSQETTKAGEKYLGKDLNINFTSDIDKKNWDGPLGSFTTGEKLASQIKVKSNEDSEGNLLSIDVKSTYDVRRTGGIFKGKDSYPGQSNHAIDYQGLTDGAALTFEQHAMVNGFEEMGLNLMNYDAVNVAQKLTLGLSGNNLTIMAATDIFPSASLDVNGIRLFRYEQPSFSKTHGRDLVGFREPISRANGGAIPVFKGRVSAPNFYTRYER